MKRTCIIYFYFQQYIWKKNNCTEGRSTHASRFQTVMLYINQSGVGLRFSPAWNHRNELQHPGWSSFIPNLWPDQSAWTKCKRVEWYFLLFACCRSGSPPDSNLEWLPCCNIIHVAKNTIVSERTRTIFPSCHYYCVTPLCFLLASGSAWTPPQVQDVSSLFPHESRKKIISVISVNIQVTLLTSLVRSFINSPRFQRMFSQTLSRNP